MPLRVLMEHTCVFACTAEEWHLEVFSGVVMSQGGSHQKTELATP